MPTVQHPCSWSQEVNLLKRYPTFSIWAAMSRMTGMDAEVSSRKCKASSAFHSLTHILWYQQKIQTSTKVRILDSVILPTLLYGLESTVLLEPHVHHLESFKISCLQIILGVSVREKKCHTTMCQMAKQPRISSILSVSSLFSQAPFYWLPRQLLMCALVGGKRSAGGQKPHGMTLWPVTLNRATCLEPGESMPKSMALGAPPSNAV